MNKILTLITALVVSAAPVSAHGFTQKDVDDVRQLTTVCEMHVKGHLSGESMLDVLKSIIRETKPSPIARAAAGTSCERLFDNEKATQSVHRRPIYGRDI